MEKYNKQEKYVTDNTENIKEEKKDSGRYWVINGQAIPVSNKLHNCLNDSRKSAFERANKDLEMFEFSIEEDEGLSRLEADKNGSTAGIEDTELVRMVLEDAFSNLTEREITIVNLIFYEGYTPSEVARAEGTYFNKIKREIDEVLAHLKNILNTMGVEEADDLL